MMVSDTNYLDDVPHEALVFIKIDAHPLRPNGELSELVNCTREHLHQRFVGKNRQELMEKIDSYMQEVTSCPMKTS